MMSINKRILSFVNIFLKHFGVSLVLISFILYTFKYLNVINTQLNILYYTSFFFLGISIILIYRDSNQFIQKYYQDFFSLFLLINTATISIIYILNSFHKNFIHNSLIFNILLTLFLLSIFVSYFIFKEKIDGQIDQENRISFNTSKKVLLSLFFIILFSFILRVYRLEYLTPFTDEFYHLLAAKRFAVEGYFEYSRSSFLSYLLGFIYKITGELTLFSARLPQVIIGSVSVYFIYKFGKKINIHIALISAYLLSTLPVAIGMSRFIREYIYFFLFLILFLCVLDYFLNLKNKIKTTKYFFAMFISLPLCYYLFVDDSNFIIQLYAYMSIYAFVHFFFNKKIHKKYYPLKGKIFLSIISIFFLTFSIFIIQKTQWLFKIDIKKIFSPLPDLNYFDALFNPSFTPWGTQIMWFSNSLYPSFFIFSLFIFGVIKFWKNKYYMASLICLSITIIPFLFFSDRYYAIRYIFYIMIFYIILFASSIYLLTKMGSIYKNRSGKIIYKVSIFIILFSIFNPMTGFDGLKLESIASTDPKTELLSYDYPTLLKKLDELDFKEGDFIISSEGLNNALTYYFNKYDFITNKENHPLMRFAINNNGKNILDMSEIYTYYYNTESIYSRPCKDSVCNLDEIDRISKIIRNQPMGWIIIDKDRNRNWNPSGFPISDFYLGDKNIRYLGSTDGYRGFDIYKW